MGRGGGQGKELNVRVKFDARSRDWPFGALPRRAYNLIMIDPPWPIEMRSKAGEKLAPSAHYPTMSLRQIRELPISELAADDCMLFVWGIWPLVLFGGSLKYRFNDFDASRSPIGACIHGWGARVAAGGAWRKTTSRGAVSFGLGYRVRSACEPFFLATFGSPKHGRASRNIFDGLRRAHSEKPEEAYAWCEAYMPHARRLELFSRKSRPGWDTCGLEAGKLDRVTHDSVTASRVTG